MNINIVRSLKKLAVYSIIGLLIGFCAGETLYAAEPLMEQKLNAVRVSIKSVNVTLENLLQMIEQKSPFKFVYNDLHIPLYQRSTLNVKDKTVGEVLDELAHNYDLVFTLVDNLIVVRNDLAPKTHEVPEDTHNIVQGIVTDSLTHEKLIRASLFFIGTSIGASTDIEGVFKIANVPDGNYKLRVSYVGYETKEIELNLKAGKTVNLDVQLSPSMVMGQAVEITAQAFGQASAINQQLNSNRIINVVSEEKIKELPDANAAEALGRLPGVSIIRSGGEASKIVLRGMESKYVNFTVDGSRLAQTEQNSRNMDLSSISQGAISGIELIKAITADQDGDAIAGVVNLVSKKAPSTRLFQVTGTNLYNRLDNSFKQYIFSLNFGQRFFDDMLGFQLSGNTEQRIRSNETLTIDYDINLADGKDYEITKFQPEYTPETRTRSGIKSIIDFNTPDEGSIKASIEYNRTKRDYTIFRRNYPINTATVSYSTNGKEIIIDIFNSSLKGENYFAGFQMNWGLTFSESKNRNPYNYQLDFTEPSVLDAKGQPISGMQLVPVEYRKGPYEKIINYALNNFNNAYLEMGTDYREQNRDAVKCLQLDIKKEYSVFDFLGEVKFGGKYTIFEHAYSKEKYIAPYQYGDISFKKYMKFPDGTIGFKDFSGTRFDGLQRTISGFVKFINFFNNPNENRKVRDLYTLNPLIDKDGMRAFRDINLKGVGKIDGTDPEYYTDYSESGRDNSLTERISAMYAMNTLNFGSLCTAIAGVRIETEDNDYLAKYTPYPLSGVFAAKDGEVRDTTSHHSETVVLPNFHVILKPTDFMNVRFAAYKAISRPDYDKRLPKMILYSISDNNIVAGNTELVSTKAWCYEVNTQFFGNTIGLFSLSAFYKSTEDQLASIGSQKANGRGVIDSLGIRLPNNQFPFKTEWKLNYPYNSSLPTKIWGFEIEHQANFRFLPGFLKNFVLNYNLSIMRSETYNSYSRQIKYTYTLPGIPFPMEGVYTVWDAKKGKLPNATELFYNIAVGYDYGGFSGRLSVFHQAEYTKSYSENRRSNEVVCAYTRYDLTLKQQLNPYLTVGLNINDISNYVENYADYNEITGWSLTTKSMQYGTTGDIWVRITL